jgi:hypothetical protein
MNAPTRSAVVWSVLAIVIGMTVYALLPTGPVILDTPFMREYARIHDICSKLRFYAEENPSSSVRDFSGKSVDDLAAAGIMSLDDARYIREHRIEFRGFDPTRIGGDVPVLETIFTNTKTPKRIVGYTDGSTVAYDLKKTP